MLAMQLQCFEEIRVTRMVDRPNAQVADGLFGFVAWNVQLSCCYGVELRKHLHAYGACMA